MTGEQIREISMESMERAPFSLVTPFIPQPLPETLRPHAVKAELHTTGLKEGPDTHSGKGPSLVPSLIQVQL